jgi:hypothetical protein
MTTHFQGFLQVVAAPLPDCELELSGVTPITGKLESQGGSLSKLNCAVSLSSLHSLRASAKSVDATLNLCPY